MIRSSIHVSALAILALGTVACGGGGSSSSGTVTPPPPPAPVADTTAPAISFSPTSLSIIGGSAGVSSLTATDNIGLAATPTTTCTNGGAFTGSTFTAPIVTSVTTSVCTASASDAAGNSSSATLTVTINPDTTAPTLTFTPSTLTASGGSTATATLTVTDNAGTILSPSFSCTNGGSFSGTTFTAPAVTAETIVVCSATATDASGNTGTAELTATVTPAPESVTVSGSITFDHVPNDPSSGSLDYDSITQDPVPGVTVEAVNGAGTVLESTVTDGNGAYTMVVPPNTDLAIRVKAEMVQTSGAQWDVRVIDNTSLDALYTFQGSFANTGSTNSVRSLNAASGWDGVSYSSPRVAGPFAILAPIYESLQSFAAIDSDVVFPSIEFNWSVNNRAGMNDNVSFLDNIANGDIGTSSFVTTSDGSRKVLILGDANDDTDEYDEHVVIHEWGHYFENQLSRSDSIGGPHGLGDRLDPRVALSEGFGNALSGMITGDSIYRDSFGFGQGQGFGFNVENNNNQNEGWFNEGSTQSILFDIFDSVDDSADTLSAGLGPIYEAFTSPIYTESNFFTTIFSFVEAYNSINPGDATAVNALTAAQSINGTGAAGIGETNNGIVSTSLPIYNNAVVGGGAIEVCTNDTNGEDNKLGNRIYIAFNVTSPGAHTFTMTRTSGSTNTDPDFFTSQTGVILAIAQSGVSNTETDVVSLNTGPHLIDAFDFNNNDACYDFSITR